MSLPVPAYRITYNDKDVTRDLGPDLISITYLDRTEVESDEIEVVLDDRQAIWSNQWYPRKLGTLTVELGYVGYLVKIGQFEVDSVHFKFNSSGRTVTIKALSAVVSQALRTKNTRAYENITLKRLATTVAAKAHLTVSGQIENIQLDRETQQDETDLAFLRRVSEDYGYMFSLKEGKIVFTKLDNLQSRSSVGIINPLTAFSIDIDDATGRTYSVAKQTYYDPAKGQILQYDQSVKSSDPFATSGGRSVQDVFATKSYIENKQQAELKAKAKRLKIENGQISGTVVLSTGNPNLVAGNNIELEKIGVNSGIYFIESSRHVLVKNSGYGTAIEVYKVGSVPETRF